MTNFFTKLASAFTLLALVASFVPAAVFAEEVPAEVVETTPEVISDVVIETPVVEEAPVEESEEIVNQEETPVVEEETGIVEEVINSVASLFSAVDDISLDAVVVPEPAKVTIDRAVVIDSNWTTDRHEPASWNNGTVGISGALDSQQQGSTFYRTEGRKTSLNNVSSVEASLYIDPAWENTAVRAGLWATGNGAVGEWGIIDYTSAAGYVAGNTGLAKDPVFRTWNSTTGTWTPVMEAVPGQTYVLRVEVADGNWNYYINGDLLSQVPLDGTAGTSAIKEVILNQYNYGAEGTPADGVFGNRPYTVQWSDMGVTNSFDTLSAAIAAANAGDTIVLNHDVTETTTVNVDKKVTIEGNGHTVTAATGVTGSVVLVTASDVTIKNLTVDAARLPVQGIQAYVATNVTLDGVTAKNANKSGIMVNGSTVTVNNVTTSGNNWHGINVDQGSGVTTPAVLTVTGTSSHSDIGPAIFVDDTNKGSVNADAQYTVVDQAPAKAYYLNTVKSEAELNAALAAHIPTITLSNSFSVSSQVTADHAVTVNGNGKTITASGALTGSVVLITGANVSVNDLTVVGKAGVHGIQAYATTGVILTDVTVKNSGKSGLLVNGSTVTVTNLTTSGNGWNGVNVDRGVNVVTAAELTVNGVSKHDENDAIWVDDIAKANVSVIDTNGQYVSSERVSGAVTGRVYVLRPEEPSRGRSGGSSRSTATNTGTGTAGGVDGGQVLGASTYNFSANLSAGSNGADVNALQQMLIDAGLLKIAAPTGFFGPMTTEALKAWQAAHGVPATGFFGPLTMAAIAAATPAPTMTEEARAALIKDILEKVKELQEKLDAMKKDAA